MEKLFEDNDSFDFISLERLASLYLENDNERIELAGFQRGSAWKSSNVEELWDSLLRWFPIGSILLARSKEFSEVKHREPQLSTSAKYTEISKEDADEDIYILIDGQQRSNAIALGFLPWNRPKADEAGARLWIDLGEPANRNKKQYDFYLCTLDDPFGEGITKAQKRQAFKSICKEGKDDSEIFLNDSYPAKAKMPVPFAEFVQALKGKNDWEKIREQLLAENYLNLSQQTQSLIKEKLSNPPRQDIQDLLKTVHDVVINEKYKIPAILFRNRADQISSKQLGKVFERIIVLAALRMVKPEYTELNLANFERITEDHQEPLLSLLEHKDGKDSDFKRCMDLAYQALHYRGNEDYGLPRQLIYRLRPRVWHTILYWIYHRDGIIGDVPDADRFNMVRLALLDALNYFLFVGWWRGLSNYMRNTKFDRLLLEEVIEPDDFSAINIFNKVKDRVTADDVLNETQLKILAPEEYRYWISPDHEIGNINWRSHNEGGNVFLQYAQREYLHKWEYLNDLDKDHIIPYRWMNFRGYKNSKFWKLGPNSVVAKEGRSPVMNSPGNFRYWPSSLNRQYQDDKPSDKLITNEFDRTLDPNHIDRDLATVNDVVKASFLNDNYLLERIHDIENVNNGNDLRIWTDDRYKNFKRFVDQRCYLMYKELYETLKLDEIDN